MVNCRRSCGQATLLSQYCKLGTSGEKMATFYTHALSTIQLDFVVKQVVCRFSCGWFAVWQVSANLGLLLMGIHAGAGLSFRRQGGLAAMAFWSHRLSE